MWRCAAKYKQERIHEETYIEGVMVDRNISRKRKGKVLDSCLVPASTYGLETLALHQHKLYKYVRTTG